MPAPQHPFARLAWEAIRAYLERDELITPPAELPVDLIRPGGVFVSLKKAGRLRGCIGTVEATRPSRAEEIIRNAVHAATMDPRFDPLQEEEFKELEVSVDLLDEPETVEDQEDLDPRRFGLIVSAGDRRALLLPEIEGVETAQQQLELALKKAGIGPDEPVTLQRFETRRYR